MVLKMLVFSKLNNVYFYYCNYDNNSYDEIMFYGNLIRFLVYKCIKFYDFGFFL